MKILVIRFGAWGDSIIITPLLRELAAQGHEVYLHTSEVGMKILAGNPHVTKFIPYVSNSVPDDKLAKHFEDTAREHGCERTINLCESIERALSFHPHDPMYSYTKQERRLLGDQNFYEYTFDHAKVLHQVRNGGKELPCYRGELFFDEYEEARMEAFFQKHAGKFVIIWGLSGSGLNKAYPWTDYVIGDLLRDHEDVVVVTVGDELCQALEGFQHPRVIRKSGRWTMREASLATKYASLVVAPDTGLLHAAGCFPTPKIGLIGSNTKNNITKHFENDYSIEADQESVPCAPCFRLIYQAGAQCPLESVSMLPICMAMGIDPKKVLERIEEVYEHAKRAPLPSLSLAR